jgi:signal transduction histidine kinase
MTEKKPSGPLRILLVEDSDHDQIAFLRALERSEADFEVTACGRSEEIPQMMQSGSTSFDVVVVDYNLPGQNGLEAFRRIVLETDPPPFVMLTGTGSEYLAVAALQAGMYDYIIKDPNQGYLQLLPLKLLEVKKRHDERQARLKAKAQLKATHAMLEQTVNLRTADLARTVEALQDEISERLQVESALRESETALRALTVKIVETQENERRLLSKELHDSIGGSLAAIKFALEEKLQHMAGDPPESVVSLEKVVGYVLDTIKEVRRLSTSLRPSMLDDLGLLATARWFCRNSGEMYGGVRIETAFDLREDDLPESAKIVIYRVMQEALNNALKHSGGDTVRVTLQNAGGRIRMRVEDDGLGFDPDKEVESRDPLTGYGLQGMRDRAEIIGGRLSIDSDPGRGTSVCLELPVEIDPAAGARTGLPGPD